MLRPHIELIIFDCDGVLVDSETIAAQILTEHLQNLGLITTRAQTIARYRGKSAHCCMVDIAQRVACLPNDFWSNMQRDTFTAFANCLEPVRGVPALLQSLQKHLVKFCIASSGDHEKLQLTLEKTQLLDYFQDRIYSATEVECGKPAPDLFLFAAAKMAVAPKNCVVIEDSLPGVQAALAAGMQVIAYIDDASEHDLRCKIQVLNVKIITSMDALLPLLHHTLK